MNKIITQIGSLPYENIKEAIEYSLRHDIPFLPELPRLGDSMQEYAKSPGKLSCLDDFKKAVSGYDIVKIQCIGPASLLLLGYERKEAYGITKKHLTDLINNLNAKSILAFIDEPGLKLVSPEDRNLYTGIIKDFDILWGVHMCGEPDDCLFDSSLEIISFDASKYDITRYGSYRSGKRISWGIERRENIKEFRRGDLLTLPCGMNPPKYKIEDCEKELKKLRDVKNSLNE
ncbi:hypothetical protein HZA33_03945 [Candidatus Pacearchaeota archaeon]|nr:hypothetical protein [Candidatus Pacearchaeota archaeon]